jgi:hypothetical protein
MYESSWIWADRLGNTALRDVDEGGKERTVIYMQTSQLGCHVIMRISIYWE